MTPHERIARAETALNTNVLGEPIGAMTFDQIREAVLQARNRSERTVTLPTADLLRVLPSDPDASIHAVLVKHCIAVPEHVVRDISLYLFGSHCCS
jgi:hypothetical protein